MRVVEFSLAGQQQSEQQVRLEAVGIGVDGAAIKASGFAGFVLGIGYVSGVEEGAGVLGVIGEPRGELGFGGFPVRFDDEGFCIEDRLRRRLRGGGGGLRCLRLFWVGLSVEGGDSQQSEGDSDTAHGNLSF